MAVSPRRLYEAFLDPADLVAWFPPTGFHAEVHELDATVGGSFHISFHAAPNGVPPVSYTFTGTYLELVRGERIVFAHECDNDGYRVGGEMLVTVTFEPVGDGTAITVHQSHIPAADANAVLSDSLVNLADSEGG